MERRNRSQEGVEKSAAQFFSSSLTSLAKNLYLPFPHLFKSQMILVFPFCSVWLVYSHFLTRVQPGPLLANHITACWHLLSLGVLQFAVGSRPFIRELLLDG